MDWGYLHAGFSVLLAVIAYLSKRELDRFDELLKEASKKLHDLEYEMNQHIRNDLNSHGAISADLINIKDQLNRVENNIDKLTDILIRKE